MASKDLKAKQRIGRPPWSARKKAVVWVLGIGAFSGAAWATWHYTGTTPVDVAVARVRKGDFVISINGRGEIRSTRSATIVAPQVPDPYIVKLAESGHPVRKGEVVIEFDAVQQEQNYLDKATGVRGVDSEIVQLKASQKMDDESDRINLLQAQFNVQRATLEASKAEILSEIEGAKDRIDVTVSKGDLGRVQKTLDARQVAHAADNERLDQKKDKTVRDMETAQQYMTLMKVRAPSDGIFNILPNFRAGGSFGQSPPPFKEGDRAWTGAAIAEIPDLTEMRIELMLEEVDRGKIKIGQPMLIRVDAIPEKEFHATLDWISPIASLVFRTYPPEKLFPARATLKNLDPRLRPGMSASARIVVERQPNVLLIPTRASFLLNGKPTVYIQEGQSFFTRAIQVGRRSDDDIVVTGGLKEGELVTLESPADAAKRARKKL